MKIARVIKEKVFAYLAKCKKDKKDKLMKRYGFIIYCHNCKSIINEDEFAVDKEGYYIYKCSKCSKKTIFRFDIAPVPIWFKKNIKEF